MPRDKFNMKTNAELVSRSIRQFDIPAFVNERNDIVVAHNNKNYKISGSAYRVVSQRAFHHGTMLINANLERLRECLRPDPRILSKIDSKAVKSVSSPVINLSQLSFTVDHLSVCQSIVREFLMECASPSVKETIPLSFEDIDEEFVEMLDKAKVGKIEHVQNELDKLKSWDWMFGQTPDFHFDSQKVHRGRLEERGEKFDVFIYSKSLNS